jgi:hypothetical protein
MVGGVLMVYSGYASHSIIYQAAGQYAPVYLSGWELSTASLAISFLELLNALGGITVFVGGMVLLSGHARTGRIVILLGGGAGLIGLLVTFGYSAFKLGLSQTLSYAPYWIGLVLAVSARRVAKGARNQVKAPAPAA